MPSRTRPKSFNTIWCRQNLIFHVRIIFLRRSFLFGDLENMSFVVGTRLFSPWPVIRTSLHRLVPLTFARPPFRSAAYRIHPTLSYRVRSWRICVFSFFFLHHSHTTIVASYSRCWTLIPLLMTQLRTKPVRSKSTVKTEWRTHGPVFVTADFNFGTQLAHPKKFS